MKIYITSGEGEMGTTEEYNGALTVKALKARVTRERCGGDRWVKVSVGSSLSSYEECAPSTAIERARRGG